MIKWPPHCAPLPLVMDALSAERPPFDVGQTSHRRPNRPPSLSPRGSTAASARPTTYRRTRPPRPRPRPSVDRQKRRRPERPDRAVSAICAIWASCAICAVLRPSAAAASTRGGRARQLRRRRRRRPALRRLELTFVRSWSDSWTTDRDENSFKRLRQLRQWNAIFRAGGGSL